MTVETRDEYIAHPMGEKPDSLSRFGRDTSASVYQTQTGAEAAYKVLQQSGFDANKLSIISKDYPLTSTGLPDAATLQYETQISAGKYLLFVKGTPQEISHAESLLMLSGH